MINEVKQQTKTNTKLHMCRKEFSSRKLFSLFQLVVTWTWYRMRKVLSMFYTRTVLIFGYIYV